VLFSIIYPQKKRLKQYKGRKIAMLINPNLFLEKLKQYPGTYLTPGEQEVVDNIINSLTDWFGGVKFKQLSHGEKIALVIKIVEVIVSYFN